MTSDFNSRLARVAPLAFVLLWSTGFIGTKYGVGGAEPFTLISLRMAITLAFMAVIVAVVRPRWPDRTGIGHSIVAGLLMQAGYLGGITFALRHGVPSGLTALIAGLQPVLTSTLANRWLGERVSAMQWLGLGLGLVGVVLVLHGRPIFVPSAAAGWLAAVLGVSAITVGTIYQKRYCGKIDWRAGNFVQYAASFVVALLVAFLTEDRTIIWSPEFVIALFWLSIPMSIGVIGLLYWLIRQSAATQVASLFYLVPAVTAVIAYFAFGEVLDLLSLVGMAICAAGVFLVNWKRSVAAS